MSVNAQLAKGAKLYIAGSASAAEVLTAVTVGFPTILAITGHAGVANGDLVTLAGFTGEGAATLNGKTAVVKNYATGATNDTFAIDINTVGLTITIDAGNTTATPAAWTQVKELKGINPSNATVSKLDATDLDSDAMEYLAGLPDQGTLTFDINVLESDPGQAACLAKFLASENADFKIATASKTRTFNGTITKWPTIPVLAVNAIQTGQAEIQVNGAVTVS